MKCSICGGESKSKFITYNKLWGGQIYKFIRVPAEVCASCGKITLSEETEEKLIEIIKGKLKFDMDSSD